MRNAKAIVATGTLSSRLPQVGTEEPAQLLGVQLWLLERREVPAMRGLGYPHRRSACAKAAPYGPRTIPPGESEKPDGTSTRRASCACGLAAFAWCMRIDEPIVRVSQQSVTLVKVSSLVKLRATSPPQSLHARSFSTIQAASPDGESASAKTAVCGLLRCMAG